MKRGKAISWSSDSQTVILGPALSSFPGKLLATQSSCPALTHWIRNSVVGPALSFPSPPGNSDVGSNFVSPVLEEGKGKTDDEKQERGK